MKKRPHYLFIALFCSALMGAALFFQLVVGLEPCPLCIFQRMAIIFIGVIGLLAFLHNSVSIVDRIYSILLALGGIASVGIASRQVWLLSLPKETAASCGPGLEVALDKIIAYLPQGTLTEMLFRSTAECTEITWTLFGFGLPQLTYPVFILFACYLLWLLSKRNVRKLYSF